MSGVIRKQEQQSGTPPITVGIWDCGDFGLDQRLPSISEFPEGFLTATNGYFTRKRSFKQRPGFQVLPGTLTPGVAPDGFFNFWINDVSEYTLAISNGNLYQYNWNTNTWVILSILPPTNAGVTFSSASGTLVAGTYTYYITAKNYQGETTPTVVTITTTATGENILSWSNQTAATQGYVIYGRISGSLQQLVTLPPGSTTWTDNGSISPAGNFPPVDNSANFLVGKRFSFAVLQQYVIFGNGYNHNYIYDGTNLQDIDPSGPFGGNGLIPCAYFTRHQDRIFASGNKAGTNPQYSWVFYCANEDPTNWNQGGIDAGSVAAAQGEDPVVGLASYRNELYIFKGPTVPQYFILTGASYDNFALVQGKINVTGFHHSIVNVGNDLYVMSVDGIYSLNQTWTGLIDQARISDPIINTFESILDPSLSYGIYDFNNNFVVWYINTEGDQLTQAIVLTPPDQASKNYRWASWNMPAATLAQYAYTNALGWVGFLGDASGQMDYWDWSLTNDLGTEISCNLAPNYVNFGNIRLLKRAKNLTVTFIGTSIIVSAIQANGTTFSTSLTGASLDTWGVNDGTWGINDGTWQSAIATTKPRFLTGASSAWSFSIQKTTGDFEIFNFQVQMDFGSQTMVS